jgi:hypothetical protein
MMRPPAAQGIGGQQEESRLPLALAHDDETGARVVVEHRGHHADVEGESSA